MEHKEQVIARFRETTVKEEMKKPRWGMSAVLGCEVYDQNQHNRFADVLKAADAEMYQDKTAMKAELLRKSQQI